MFLFYLFLLVAGAQVAAGFGSRHDYVKDGRSVDGPFPSNLRNIPYLCYQAPSKGPCGLMLHAWFFDIVTRKCMPMYYSGCGGNENRFESQAECKAYCTGVKLQ
ncbi:amyloid-beta precursor protein-like [Leguminivora glycinivorella]|uniref:amyloid-beta precursor protein-like n=1 Tax=Leguminivora glycinivorella TaxID=1035111 RepID=UPI00200BC95C|nr:amyloid-beta precursor protein-like [Leguminivora glycinivorella]